MWHCFFCVCILQVVSRAHVNDCVEDLGQECPDGGVCVWLCFYCVCILQKVSRVAHGVEDLRQD